MRYQHMSTERSEHQASFTGIQSKSSPGSHQTHPFAVFDNTCSLCTDRRRGKKGIISLPTLITVQALNPASENMHQNIHNLIVWEETIIILQRRGALSYEMQEKTRTCPSNFMTDTKTCQHFIMILLTLWDQGKSVATGRIEFYYYYYYYFSYVPITNQIYYVTQGFLFGFPNLIATI